jgi:hypothetical protein
VNPAPCHRRALIPITFLALLALLIPATACRSAFFATTIENDGAAPIHLIEVDYPSASFGTQSIDAHAVYQYRFKIQGSGPITLNWTDAAGKSHTAAGPTLNEGQQGDLRVTIDPSARVTWSTTLSRAR